MKPPIGYALSASERRVARQTLWTSTMLAVQVLGGVATVALSARILGAEGFGVLAVVAAVSGLVYGLAAMRGRGADTVTTFVTRCRADGRSAEAKRILRFALAVSLTLACIAYAAIAVLASAAAGLLEIGPEHRSVLLLYGVTGLLTAVNGESQAVLRLADRMLLGVAVAIAGVLLRFGLLVAVWLTGGGIVEVVLVQVAAAAVNGLGTFAAAVVSAPRAGLAGFLRSASLEVPPEVVRYHAGGFLGSGMIALRDNLDVILLAQFASTAEVGLYSAARRVAGIAGTPIASLRTGVLPEYSRLWYSGRGPELRRVVLRVTLLSVTLATAGFGLLALLREPVIRFFLGSGFSGAAPLLPVLLLGVFLTVAPAFRILPMATGRVWSPLLSQTAGLVVFLAAVTWLAPAYGAAGAAWARTTSVLASFLVITPFALSILRQGGRP